MRVLVVEDESALAIDLATGLEDAGFAVQSCGDGDEAWFLGGTEDYAAIVLDLGLPKLDGLTVLRRWRAEGRHVPVIVLTARGNWTERVAGINAGADDYMSKPFKMQELVARIRALLRRSTGHSSPQLGAGTVRLDTVQMQVTVDGKLMQLTPLEFRLASYFLHHKGRVISREELREHVYGHEDDRDVNALEALIARLRRKLGTNTIDTRRGFGYCFKGD